MRVAASALVLACCSFGCSGDSNDVVGPFTGEVHRYYVDTIRVPRDGAEAAALAADLDGDDVPENAFGNVTGVLTSTTDLTMNAPEMIASGAIASIVEIQADDLADDASVGVRLLGAADATAIVAGGRFTAGAFVSNRTRETTHPGMATVHLPIYTNADPLVLPLEGMELELTPDGAGGYDGIVRGGLREETARAAAYAGLVQMFETEPNRHLVFGRGIDTNHDDVISREEVDASVIAILVSADIEHYAGITAPSLSVAFAVHLSAAAPAMGAPTCRDRMRNGDESDVDCGGSCQTCWAAKACSIAADCQSGACNAGRCAAPTCSDGVRDGYESDADCGGSCAPCTSGKVCATDRDCAGNNCDNGVSSLGVCH